MPHALIRSFFDPATFTVTHVVADASARRAAVIDPVLDYDPKSGATSTANADAVIAFVREAGLTVDWLLETHAHADHLSAAPYLQRELGGRLAIGALEVEVMHTPGHTPGCVSYCVASDDGLDVFIGDTLFMPDYGSARCDFPGGDAAVLFRSVRRLLALPPETRLHLCHDYPPAERAPQWRTTVAEQRRANIHLHEGIDEPAFVAMRTARDKTLGKPVLLLPAIQVNVRAGHWPAPESNGLRYLKIPLNAL